MVAPAQTPTKSAKTTNVDLVKLIRSHDYSGLEAALNYGADPNGVPKKVPLSMAAILGDVKAVKILIAHKADPNIQTKVGTPLCSAAWIDSPQIASILLDAGADPNGRKDELCPPIVMTHSVAVLRVLLEAHVDIEATCNDGQRLLHGACDAANEGIVALLLAHKAQIEPVDTTGSTPLMYLGDPAGWPEAESARIRIAKRLIQEGANISAKNKRGLTAFDVAKEHGLTRLAIFLAQASRGL